MIAWLKSKKSLRDVFVGVMGASTAQVIGFILVPVVARLFSPEDFGKAAAFLAVFAVLLSIASLRFEEAIMLPRAEEEAKALTGMAFRILFAITLISVLGVFLISKSPLNASAGIDPVLWVVLLPFFLLVSGSVNILISWNTRLKKFSHIATSDLMLALGTSVPRIGFGYVFGSSVLGLLAGSLIGYVASALALWNGVKVRMTPVKNLFRLPRGAAGRLMAEYKDFPIYSAPTGFVRELKENIPLFGLMWLFSAQMVGFYAMAIRLVRLPVSVVSMPVRRVFMQRALQIRHDGGEIRGLLLKSTGLLLALGALPLLLLVEYGSELFSWLLGARWEGAGRYAEILAVWLFSIFTLTPSAASFTVVRKQKIWLYFQILGALTGAVIFLFAGYLSLGDYKTLVFFSLSQVFLNVVVFFVALRVSSGIRHESKTKAQASIND